MSLDAIGIISSDIPTSVEFYGMLGVSLKQSGGPEHWEGTTPSGIRIMLDSAELMKDLNPDWKPPKCSGIILCFKQDTAEAVDKIFIMLTRHGFKGLRKPWDAFWGQRYASILDPDGYQIDIFAKLPE